MDEYREVKEESAIGKERWETGRTAAANEAYLVLRRDVDFFCWETSCSSKVFEQICVVRRVQEEMGEVGVFGLIFRSGYVRMYTIECLDYYHLARSRQLKHM